ncbi:MAG: MoxR family ATPase [Acidobacteria bacterium]|nr:MoxR family ATPase [Acidobacteriota bacterium]
MKSNGYPFRIIRADSEAPLTAEEQALLLERPFTRLGNTFAEDARRFIPGPQLETAINAAVAVGEPLLITGEPGTGKTQAAYYTAYKLGLELLHFQVKSDSSATDLLYHFDTVRYFRDASLGVRDGGAAARAQAGEPHAERALNKEAYLEPRPLWIAFESPLPMVLLIDEIDKAPRDFPNDLLHELDKMEFTVSETGKVIKADEKVRPIVFITSNSERRLPEPFLRRCVYHHIRFDERLIAEAVHRRSDEYRHLDRTFLDMAIQRFLALRQRNLRKRPSTGELLVWLRVMSTALGTVPEVLDSNLSKLPFLGTLLKDHQDIEELGTQP